MVITFSNIKGTGGGGATGGTVSGITLWSSDYTQEYIDNALSGVTDALSAYTPTSGFSTINGSAITTGDNLVIEGTPYSGGTNIDITDHVISVTGITIPTSNTAFTNDAGYITSGDAQTQIDDAVSGKQDTSAMTAYYTSAETDTAISNAVSGKMDTAAMSAYTPTSGFSTINGSAITEGGNITVEETPYSAGTGIGISEHVISVTGDYETVVELTQAEYDALTAYSENTTYIITDAPSINMSAYTPTSGFSTINGSAITTGEAIVIEETEYSAGTNINIANHVISVTGITVPTKVSDLTNDAGYITTADTKDFVTSGDVKSQIEGYNYVNSGDVKTQIEDYGYITEDALSGYSTTEEMNAAITAATDGLASETYVDNSVSGKQDTSAMTAYYTSAQTNTAISNATSGKADSSAVTADIAAATAATTGWVSEQGYLTGYTESDPIFTGSPAYGITSNDITNWNSVSGKVDTSAMTQYYTSAQTDTAISNATSGLASQTWVENKGYLTSYTETDPVFMASAASGITSNDITNWNAVSGKQDTLVNQVNIKSINGTSLLGSGNIQISEGGTYTGGDNIEITAQNVINVTGITSYTGITSGDVVTALGYTPISGVDLSEYYTSAQTQSAITSALTPIEQTVSYAVNDLNTRVDQISGSQITTGTVQSMITAATSGKMDTSAMTQYYTSAQTNTAISNATSGLASTTYVDNSVSGKADTSALTQYYTSAQTQSAITEAITPVEQTVSYAVNDLNTRVNTLSANSVTTGTVESMITSATSGKVDTSALTQYYTSAQTDTAISNAVSGKADTSRVDEVEEVAASALTNLNLRVDELSGNSVTTGTVETMINNATSGLASTTYVDNSVSGKADTSAVTADIASATAATTGWVENQGYLTAFTESDPIFTGSPAYGITSENITNWDSVSGKVDTSAMVAYYTSAQTNTAISNATSGLASQTWVENKGYITGYTETDPIFTGSPAYGITAQDITNWNAVTGLTIPTSNTAFTNDAGYITEDAISGKADTTAVTQSIADAVSGKVDTSAMTQYATTGSVDSLTNRLDEVEEVAASALTNLNTRVNQISGSQITTGTVESMITAATSGFASTTYVDNSVSGKLDTTAFTAYTASTQTTLNAKVGSSDSSVSDIVKMSQNDYDALTVKSSTTLYIIV